MLVKTVIEIFSVGFDLLAAEGLEFCGVVYVAGVVFELYWVKFPVSGF